MRIEEMLDRAAVVPALAGITKIEVLRELSLPLVNGFPPRVEPQLSQALLERERLGSTGLAEGVAIPHAKVRGLDRMLASFGRSLAGVEFEALDRAPTHLFFALFAPDTAGGDHLRALARISRIFRNVPFRAAVLQAPGADEIYRLICEEDNRF
jgi:PTS system nitrogen regulatory IIA component